MSRDKKILWGILAILPVLAIVVSMVLAFNTLLPIIIEASQSGLDIEPEALLSQLAGLWIGLSLISLFSAVVWIFFLVFSIKDRSSKGDEQVLWVIVLIFFNFIALPLYWYFRMWKNPNFNLVEELTDRTN